MKVVACAVVHERPPLVYVADDIETLSWVLAWKVVAQTPESSLPDGAADGLRAALVDERWGDAVAAWIEHTGVPVDVYSAHDLFTEPDARMAPVELQFTPLFRQAADGE